MLSFESVPPTADPMGTDIQTDAPAQSNARWRAGADPFFQACPSMPPRARVCGLPERVSGRTPTCLVCPKEFRASPPAPR